MLSSPVGPRHLSWLVGAVVLLCQLAMVRDVSGPLVYADELGYIAAARYFAPGVPDVQMLSSFYHFGYGLLLAPLVVFFDEPGPFYRAATLFNVGLAVSATVVFHRVVLLRHSEAEPGPAALAALGFGLAPSLLMNTSIVWAETVLVAVFVLLVAGIQRVFDRPTLAASAGLGVLGALAYSIRPRAIVLTASLVLLLLLAVAVGRLRPQVGLLGAAVAAIGVVVVRWVNTLVWDALYTEGSVLQSGTGLVDTVVEEPGQWLAGLGGTAWYQLLASAGLVAVGIWYLVGGLILHSGTNERRSAGKNVQPVPFFVLLSLGLSWLVGGVISVSADPRIDQLFYGRYLDIFAPTLIGFGVLALARRARSERPTTTTPTIVTSAGPIAVGALVIAVGGWLVSSRGSGSFFLDAPVVAVNVPVAAALRHLSDTWDPTAMGQVGALGLLAVFAGFRWRREAGVAILVGVSLLVSEVTLAQTVRPASHAGLARAGLAAPIEDVATDGVVLVAAPYEFWTLNGLQFWADDVQFALETHCPTAAFDAVIGSVEDARYSQWVIEATDAELGRQVLLDPTAETATSRSVAISIVEAEAEDGVVVAVVEISNLDLDRSLAITDPIVLHARFSRAGEAVAATPLDLEGPIVQPPLATTRHMLEFRTPEAVREMAVDLSFDLHDAGRGWLSRSPCAESSFSSVSVDID